MANGSDGSIVIDTELDTEGVENGAEKTQKMLNDLRTEIQGIGKTLEQMGTLAVSALRELSQNTGAIYAQVGQGATQAADANARFASSMGAAQKSVSGAAQAASAYDKALAKTQKQIDAQKAKLAEYYRAVAEVKANTDEALTHTTTDDQAAAVLEIEEIELKNLNDKYAAQLKTLRDLEAEYQRLAAAQAQARQSEGTTPTYDAEAVKAVKADIEKASKAVDGYQAKVERMQALGATDRAWEATQYDIGQATARLEEYRSRLEALNEAGKISPEDYERLSAALSEAAEKVQQLAASMQGLSTFKAHLQQIGSSALGVVSSLAKIPFRAAAGGAKLLGNSLKSYVNNAKKATLQSNVLVKTLTSMKRLLITRVKRMFISSIFNSTKEAMQSLAKFSEGFNASMSNIKNSAKQLSGNLSVSLGGLVQKLEPAITAFINLISKAITYINALFALLGGRSTMTVAKKQTDDYAKSLAGAGGAAEYLKKQVYGFDELNKRNDDSGGGGGGGIDGADMFEEVPIDSVLPEKLRSLLEELKELWDNREYFNFGKRVGEAFNGIIESGDNWINNTFRPKAVVWAQTITEALNGLVDGVSWEALGKTVADGFNAVVETVKTFFRTLSFDTIVQAVEAFFASALQNIDTGALIAAFFLPGLLHAVKALIASHPVASLAIGAILALGPQLGETIKRMVESIDFAGFGKTLSDGIVWAVSRLSAAISSVGWGTLTQTLWDGLLAAVNNIDFVSIAASMFELLGSAVGAVAQGVSTLGENIWLALKEAWEGVKTYFAEYIDEFGGDIVAGLWAGIKDAFKNVGLWVYNNILLPFWNALCKAFKVNSPSKVMMELGQYVVEGLFQGISDTWHTITDFFSESVEAIKTTLSTAWNEIKEDAATAWDSVKTSVTQKFDEAKTSVATAAASVKADLSGAWEKIKSTTATTWETVRNTVAQKFDGMKQPVSESASTVENKVSSAWDGISSKTESAWDAIKSATTQSLDDLKQSVTSEAGTMEANLSDSWDSAKKTASTTWNSTKANITTIFGSLKSSLTASASSLKNDLSASWNAVGSTATTVWVGLRNTVLSLWNDLRSTMAQTNWTSIGSNIVSGIYSGIQSGWSWLTSTVYNLAIGLFNAAKNALGIHSPSTVFAEIGKNVDLGLKQGIDDSEQTVLKTVSNMAKNVSDQFETEDVMLDVDAEGDGLITRLGGITAKLSELANVFREINAGLSGIGEIRIPAIAAGTVVPSRTAVADSGGDAFDSPRFAAFSSDVDERMSDVTYLLRRILERLERDGLGIDIDELARVLSVMLQNRVVGYGGV